MVEWKKWEVRLDLRRRVVGAIPKNPDIIDTWVMSRAKKKGKSEEEAKVIAEKIKEEVGADPEVEKNWVGFKSDRTGVYLEDRNLKAMLREAATTLELFKGTGSVARKQTFQHGLFIKPEKIYFMRDGRPIKEPDGYQDRAIHVMTPSGPRSSLKREDYIDPPAYLEFEIWVVIPKDRKEPYINDEFIKECLELGQEIGLGGSRSQGFGKFIVKRIAVLPS